ncbi:MAG: TIGR02996 domain-containing protein [Pirellulaceae bacterium]|jgi:uncharacterized protein (TIGR02996 family)|nr:TIGR02996 domain-containing protein [Pirellulaceae bacterium]
MEYELPFIAEIRAHPEDDVPRLVYADFLEEAGDPQAELIRVQVELSRLPPGEPIRRELELREEAILAEYAEAWLEPLRALGAEGVSARSFQRGLIERVQITAENFLRHGEQLCQECPALHVLDLRQVRGLAEDLSRQALPPQITALELNAAKLGRDELAALGRAPWIEQIASLSAAFNQLDDGALTILFRHPWPGLVSLNLSVNRLTAAGLVPLVAPGILPRLARVNLSLNKLGDAGIDRLADSPLAGQLRELDLGSTGITGGGVARIVASPIVQSIERLVLRGATLGEGSERAIAALAAAPRLVQLDLRGTTRVLGRYGYGSVPSGAPPELTERLGNGLLW